MIVTVFDPCPLAIVTVPDDGVLVVDISLIDTIVPAPSLTSGLVDGKLVSFAIATNPPTSSTKSITLASIAAVVAIKESDADQVSPESIVSVLSCLKYLPSEADVVKNVVSSGVCPDCSELVTITASAILAAVTASSLIFAVVILLSAIFAVVTLESAILAVVTFESAIFAVVIFESAI